MIAKRDKLKFFIRCKRVCHNDNCYYQSCQQEDASGLNKNSRRCAFSHSLLSRSVFFFFLAWNIFIWLTLVLPNFKLQIRLWYHQIKTVEMQWSIIINVSFLISSRYAIRTNIKTASLRSFYDIQDHFTTKMQVHFVPFCHAKSFFHSQSSLNGGWKAIQLSRLVLSQMWWVKSHNWISLTVRCGKYLLNEYIS